MRRLLPFAFILTFTTLLLAQTASPTRAELEPALGFEAPVNGTIPGGWGEFPTNAVFADEKIVHSGKYSARVESDTKSQNGFATVKKSLPIDFTGHTIELRGYVKTESVGDFAGLWLREDGESGIVAFDNMQARQIKGDTEWTQYTIVLPLDPEARMLYFGALVTGSGRIWADDLQLLVDGKPIWDAPKAKPLQTDREFDGGSKIAVSELSKTQIDNLATLGKVWGFLKYHHPAITSGTRQWDYELFRVLPQVLAAQDRQVANAAMLQWIEKLGSVAHCNPCAKLDKSKLYLAPDLDWISDTSRLGPELSRTLQNIYDNRSTRKQFYISLKPEVENPSFDHELDYSNLHLPDFGYQLLALYRFWNAVQYWSPNRDIIGEDWDAVLAQSIPTVALAKDAAAYKLSLFALIARFHDGHANLWHALDARPPYGDCRRPMSIRFIEDRAVVTASSAAALVGDENGLKVGDILSALDGVPVAQLVKQWKPYYSGSNDAAIMRDIARELSRGACEPAKLTVVRGGREMSLINTSIRPAETNPSYPSHDQPGPTFRLLSKDIAYLKLSSVKSSEAVHYIEQAAGTKGLIIDIRTYPSEFVVFDLGSRLVSKDTPFATFTVADLENPGAMRWGITESIKPAEPHYSGKVIVLVDEISMSQAEYTAMAFRAAGALVVGSTTAGADGNMSAIPLPGGLQTMMSGIGVFYPDKKPTQRVGIIPDVQAKPTIAGIVAGRDEVLEVAIRQIVGSNLSANEIQQLAKPH